MPPSFPAVKKPSSGIGGLANYTKELGALFNSVAYN